MREQAKGTIDQVIGKVKETAGKLTGDRRGELEGQVQQVKGKAEETVGDLKRSGGP